MPEKVFKTRKGLAVVIPAAIARRYHLAAGVEVEVQPVEEGIFLEPQKVAPWFSIEWERALDAVVERYQGAFAMMKDEAGTAAAEPGTGPPPA